MSQPNRKRQHQESPPAVKEEQQEHEEDTHSIAAAAGINGNGSQCSSSNCENSNTMGTAAGGNGADDMNQLKLKMADLETKNQILEGKLANQELNARIREEAILTDLKQENSALWTKLKEITDEFGKRLTALETKHQQEIAGLKAIIEQQQQKPIAEMPDCVVVDMPESQGTSNNSNEIHNVAPNLVPCHSAQQQEMVEVETKRLCNPTGNYWNQYGPKATMKITWFGLIVHNSSSTKWGNILARNGFLLSACRQLLQNNFAGPIIYYFEIKIKSPSKHNESRLCIGFSNGSVSVQKGTCLGRIPNTYAMQEDKRDYCLLSGHEHFFEWPTGAIKPKWYGYGCRDVYGCGLVLSADNKLAIFFTINGVLMGKQIPFDHAGSILYPTVCLNRDVIVEANFGQKPFKYNIHECPGLQLQW